MANIFDELLSSFSRPVNLPKRRYQEPPPGTAVNKIDLNAPPGFETVNSIYPDGAPSNEINLSTGALATPPDANPEIEAYLAALKQPPVNKIDLNVPPASTHYSVDDWEKERAARKTADIPLPEPDEPMSDVGPPLSAMEAPGPEDVGPPLSAMEAPAPADPVRKVLSYAMLDRKPAAKSGARQKKSDASPATTEDSTVGPMGDAEDALLKGYKDKAGELGGERMKALERAAAEKDLSNEEKVAMALLAALPGLVGAIGGGAIGGGWGAAAGAAGGLQGGAQGMRSIAESKEGRRKEAKSDADKILEQIMQQEGLATRRQELLEGRKIDDAKSDKQFGREKELLGIKEAGDWRAAKLAADAQLTAARMNAVSSNYEARLKAEQAANAAKNSTSVSEFEGKAAQYATDMVDVLPRLKSGDFERASMSGAFLNMSDALNAARSPELQQYVTDASTFLDAVSRSRTGAGIRADEWPLYYRQYFPLANDDKKTIELKRHKRDLVTASMIQAAGRGTDRITKALSATGDVEVGGQPKSQSSGPASDWRSHPGITWGN